jgi:hypothetical protein
LSRRIGEPVWVILIVAMCLLRHCRGVGLGSLRAAAAEQVGDLLAARCATDLGLV